MGKRLLCLGLVGFLLAVMSVGVLGADPEVTANRIARDGYEDIEVSTPLANYVFSEQGGVMKSLFLSFAPYGTTMIELLSGTTKTSVTAEGTYERDFLLDAEFAFALEGEALEEGTYNLEEPMYMDSGGLVITFVGDFGDVTITKRYTIEPDAVYTVGFDVIVENRSPDPLHLRMVLGSFIATEDAPKLQYLFDGEPGTEVLAPSSYFSFGGIGWMDKTIAFFLSAGGPAAAAPFLERTAAGSQRFGVELTAPQGKTAFDFSVYGGRRRHLLMKAAGLAALDKPGIGARLMIPVIQFLEMLYRATGNYGWAIILFTILTRVILFPLMRKQYHSMAKMQRIQPKMKRIQERFKDDRQLQQQKMMELYRKEGVNPMGGCLPMLVQLPILILIWRAILYSAELIHLSPGFLWVPDLSMHDPYFILVIVTTAIMMVQQWLMTPSTGTETSGRQKYFGYIFPLFMAVLLWKFPAGLWLYYLLTTGAQVAQQAIVNREMATADGARLATAAELDAASDDEGEDDGGGEAGD